LLKYVNVAGLINPENTVDTAKPLILILSGAAPPTPPNPCAWLQDTVFKNKKTRKITLFITTALY
jgi:hypothetical protein